MTKRKIPLPDSPTILTFPPNIIYLLVLCRSNSVLESVLHNNRHTIKQDKVKIKKFYYPDDVMAWKDRREDCYLLIIESASDSLFFREEVGRVRLFFTHTILRDLPQ